jgi:sialic acid synthase SpsE
MFKNFNLNRCYIIAEIGGNFTSFEEAKLLIDEAKKCEVDAVKLQTYRADTITSKNAIFDMENTGVVSQHDIFKRYEIDHDLHSKTFSYATKQGLDWFSTPSHETDVDLLEKCGVGAYKIGSDDAINIPFLRYVAKKQKPILLSTGMCTLEEVRESVGAILGEGNNNLHLLHAITSYPTHAKDVNLGAMQALMKEFPNLSVGYSDHTLSPVACLCAVAMGAKIIEKHFTYDKKADGPDHMLSADTEEMSWIVQAVRSFELMRGSGIKMPAQSESTTRLNNRKSLVLNRSVRAGSYLSRNDIGIKRPGYGIPPKYFDQVVGRRLRIDLDAEEILTWEHLD